MAPTSNSTSYRASSDRRRIGAMVLTVLAHLLLLWLLLRIAPRLTQPARDGALTTFDVSANPVASVAGSRTPTATRTARSGGAPPRAPRPTTPPTAALPPPPPLRSPSEAPPVPIPGLLPGGEELFAASGRVMSTRSADAGSGAGEGKGSATGSDRGNVAGPGEGPGGQRLYDAELVRALPPGALAAYMPGGKIVAGWGMIACRMTESYAVENCRVLSESPIGSGFGSALRQASWQFRIRPPRIGSQAVKDVWVRIRYTFTFKEDQ
jgi:protein TonB